MHNALSIPSRGEDSLVLTELIEVYLVLEVSYGDVDVASIEETMGHFGGSPQIQNNVLGLVSLCFVKIVLSCVFILNEILLVPVADGELVVPLHIQIPYPNQSLNGILHQFLISEYQIVVLRIQQEPNEVGEWTIVAYIVGSLDNPSEILLAAASNIDYVGVWFS